MLRIKSYLCFVIKVQKLERETIHLIFSYQLGVQQELKVPINLLLGLAFMTG